MPPIRHNRLLHATRSRIDPLSDRPDGTSRRSTPHPSRKLETVDGLVRGWQYKIHYKDSIVPEFPREPDANMVRPDNPRPPSLTLEDFECVKALGKGQYGQVLLVRTTRKSHPLDKPGALFAMKLMKKKTIRALDGSEHVLKKDIERSHLTNLPWSPFVTGIVQTFYDDRSLYMMLELVPCGTLRSLIQKQAPFDAVSTAFYFANIVCALQFLGTHNIIHRDIKPENILLGADGYLCLADFGTSAKEIENDDWLLVGTPFYMPPEVITPIYGQIWTGIDWWASGCILYEMVTRKPPFNGSNQVAIYGKITARQLDWPKRSNVRVGKKLKSLVDGLLTLDPAERLGTNGCEAVMHHPWLEKVSWNKMYSREYLAPYIPPTPHLAETWHTQPLPRQTSIPELHHVTPPLHLVHDNRFPEKAVI